MSAAASQPTDIPAAPTQRLRRRLERLRGVAGEPGGLAAGDDDAELKLQLMLLREENARLKSTPHRPAGPGTAIDRVRLVVASGGADDALDDTFSLLGDCLEIREGLDQVCVEVLAAIDAVRARLDAIAAQAAATIAEVEDAAGLPR